MVSENESRFHGAIADYFKTASSEYVFETLTESREVEFHKSQLPSWMQPVEAPVPRFLRDSGHKALSRSAFPPATTLWPPRGPRCRTWAPTRCMRSRTCSPST
jgi:aldehyde dehydrogenase (NAD+)